MVETQAISLKGATDPALLAKLMKIMPKALKDFQNGNFKDLMTDVLPVVEYEMKKNHPESYQLLVDMQNKNLMGVAKDMLNEMLPIVKNLMKVPFPHAYLLLKSAGLMVSTMARLLPRS